MCVHVKNWGFEHLCLLLACPHELCLWTHRCSSSHITYAKQSWKALLLPPSPAQRHISGGSTSARAPALYFHTWHNVQRRQITPGLTKRIWKRLLCNEHVPETITIMMSMCSLSMFPRAFIALHGHALLGNNSSGSPVHTNITGHAQTTVFTKGSPADLTCSERSFLVLWCVLNVDIFATAWPDISMFSAF